MNSVAAQLGSIVLAKAGRDAGRLFIVTGIVDEKYVLIADGVTRKTDKPKKKKLMHLKVKPTVDKTVSGKLQLGLSVNNFEIANAILAACCANKEEPLVKARCN